MDSLIWILVLAGGAGLIAVGVLVWAVGSVHRDRERAALDWGGGSSRRRTRSGALLRANCMTAWCRT